MSNPTLILAEANALMEKLDPEPEHPRQVRFLAVQLFRQLQRLHELEPDDLILLEASALLHDIGWSRAVNGSAHHKHSSDLIHEHPWTSLNTEQIDLVAQIARYHRKSLPKATHQPFTQLRPAYRHKLLFLAALIRMADAMDRSHQSLVRSLECVLQGKTCLILAQSTGKADAEVRALEKKGDLFELHFCLKIEANFLSEKTSTSTRLEPA